MSRSGFCARGGEECHRAVSTLGGDETWRQNGFEAFACGGCVFPVFMTAG